MHLPLVNEYEKDINVTLKHLQHSHLDKVIFSYLNINFIRNKFGNQQKRHQINLFSIFSSYISITSPCRLHIIDNKSGLMVFVKSHIPSRKLNVFKILSNIQIIPFEINLRKKWLVASVYNAPSQKKQIFYLVCDKSIRILQKQPSRGVPWKRCSENMQQIYSRIPMPQCETTLLKSHSGMGVLL